MTNQEIEEIAEILIKQKGRPLSESEWNCKVYHEKEHLKRNGATKKQLEKIEKLVNDAPGKWIAYSGD